MGPGGLPCGSPLLACPPAPHLREPSCRVRRAAPPPTRRRWESCAGSIPAASTSRLARARRRCALPRSAHALPTLAGIRHGDGPGTSERGAAACNHRSEHDRLAADPEVERHVRELLGDDERPVVDEPVCAVIDLLAFPIERAEHLVLREEVRVLAGDGSLAWTRRVSDLIRTRD